MSVAARSISSEAKTIFSSWHSMKIGRRCVPATPSKGRNVNRLFSCRRRCRRFSSSSSSRSNSSRSATISRCNGPLFSVRAFSCCPSWRKRFCRPSDCFLFATCRACLCLCCCCSFCNRCCCRSLRPASSLSIASQSTTGGVGISATTVSCRRSSTWSISGCCCARWMASARIRRVAISSRKISAPIAQTSTARNGNSETGLLACRVFIHWTPAGRKLGPGQR